jgi:superfamily II DNA/RNA helicase
VPSTFADLGVPAPIVATLDEHGIDAPFPIQSLTLPDALAGRDLCGKAPTGSGKTIAFGIPLVARVGHADPRRPKGLVLVPTRELASQVRDELTMLAGPQGRRVDAFYGGNGFGAQLNALRRGVDIAVACPGRLMDLVNRGDVHLDRVEFVVIDEADRMADMGFLPDVRRLLDQTPPSRQTLLFSATLDGDVDVLVRHYQRHPARHELANDPADGARVTHLFWNVARDDRIKQCAKVVTASGPTIVFCRTKRGADRVARQLEQLGVRTAAIHGDRSQAQRERALEAFHRGDIEALIATDVAARGIHVDGICAVVHLDPPADEKDYVHRSGRTGRAGAEGVVVTFVAPELRKDVTRMQKSLKMTAGITSPDASPLPIIERPARRTHRPARSYQTINETMPGTRHRASRPSGGTARSSRPSARRSGSTAGSTSRSSKPAGSTSRSAKAAGGATPQNPQGNRKTRRAGLQSGGPAGGADTAGGSRRAKSSAVPNRDKGKRRQPSSGRG